MFNLISHLERQIKFSIKTFGPGDRSDGVADHILKEIGEIQLTPNDLEEWADIILLAFDGAWRSGLSPHDICEKLTLPKLDPPTFHIQTIIENIIDATTQKNWLLIVNHAIRGAQYHNYSLNDIYAMLDYKQTKNENRSWPDWKNQPRNIAIEHIR